MLFYFISLTLLFVFRNTNLRLNMNEEWNYNVCKYVYNNLNFTFRNTLIFICADLFWFQFESDNKKKNVQNSLPRNARLTYY